MSETIDCPRCKHAHDDLGYQESMTCEDCGFAFTCDVEYEPDYSTSCKEHDFGEFNRTLTTSGKTVMCRTCRHCGKWDVAREARDV